MIAVDVEMPEMGDPQKALQESMQKVSALLKKIVLMNLSEGGRPTAWANRADGSRSFLGGPGGSIGRSIRESSGDTWAEVSSGLPYSAIHQFGGVINRPSTRQAAGLWRKYYETGNDMYKRLAIAAMNRKGKFASVNSAAITAKVNIQARPYLQLTEDDVAEIAAMVGRDIAASIFLDDKHLASSLT